VIRPNAVELFGRLMDHLDDPIGDFSIFPTFLVSRLAREDVKVALSGDGGDEVFGGYETYVAQEKVRLWERIPGFLRARILEPSLRRLPPRPEKKGLVNKARRFAEGMEHDPALGHARWRLFLSQGLSRRLFRDLPSDVPGDPRLEHILELGEEASSLDPVDRSLYIDLFSYLTDNCLVKTDRMSMACSLEVRVPLLDPELVVMAFAIPSSLKVRGGETKPLLKRVAARRVPRDCVYRPKEGFSIPIKHWLRAELREMAEDSLAPNRLESQGIFQPEVVDRLLREHMAGTHNHSHILWSLLVFQRWYERWLG
jgi:asparagine synthase (glutamine-hydrolysing)